MPGFPSHLYSTLVCSLQTLRYVYVSFTNNMLEDIWRLKSSNGAFESEVLGPQSITNGSGLTGIVSTLQVNLCIARCIYVVYSCVYACLPFSVSVLAMLLPFQLPLPLPVSFPVPLTPSPSPSSSPSNSSSATIPPPELHRPLGI